MATFLRFDRKWAGGSLLQVSFDIYRSLLTQSSYLMGSLGHIPWVRLCRRERRQGGLFYKSILRHIGQFGHIYRSLWVLMGMNLMCEREKRIRSLWEVSFDINRCVWTDLPYFMGAYCHEPQICYICIYRKDHTLQHTATLMSCSYTFKRYSIEVDIYMNLSLCMYIYVYMCLYTFAY